MLHEESFEPKRLMKVRDAARLLALSERWLWARISDGSVPVFKLKGATRVALSDLEKFVEAARRPPTEILKVQPKTLYPKSREGSEAHEMRKG